MWWPLLVCLSRLALIKWAINQITGAIRIIWVKKFSIRFRECLCACVCVCFVVIFSGLGCSVSRLARLLHVPQTKGKGLCSWGTPCCHFLIAVCPLNKVNVTELYSCHSRIRWLLSNRVTFEVSSRGNNVCLLLSCAMSPWQNFYKFRPMSHSSKYQPVMIFAWQSYGNKASFKLKDWYVIGIIWIFICYIPYSRHIIPNWWRVNAFILYIWVLTGEIDIFVSFWISVLSMFGWIFLLCGRWFLQRASDSHQGVYWPILF